MERQKFPSSAVPNGTDGPVLFEVFPVSKFRYAMAGETGDDNVWVGAVARTPIHDLVADNPSILDHGISHGGLGGP